MIKTVRSFVSADPHENSQEFLIYNGRPITTGDGIEIMGLSQYLEILTKKD